MTSSVLITSTTDRKPLTLDAVSVAVYVDDVIFPAYPKAILLEERLECARTIELAGQEILLLAARKEKKTKQLTTIDETGSFGMALLKAIKKCDLGAERAGKEKKTAQDRIVEIDKILEKKIDPSVTLTVYLNGEQLVTKQYTDLPREHRVERLEVSRELVVPTTSKVTLRATLTGRWKDEDLSATVFASYDDDLRGRAAAARQRMYDASSTREPTSQFDDDYLDDMSEAVPHILETLELEEQLEPRGVTSELALKTLSWENDSGASVINGKAFRLQIRTEIMFEVLLQEALALRSHSVQLSSSNTLQTVKTRFIYLGSHFGDKHAAAGTIALYKRYTCVLADETDQVAAQNDMTWYLETSGGRVVPRIRGPQKVLETRIAPCLTSPGSATRLMANAFRKLGVPATLAALRENWLKETSPGNFRDDVAEHRTAVIGFLILNDMGLSENDKTRLLDHEQPKVLLWMRGRPFKTEGNPSPKLILQLALELAKRNLIPLIFGETFPLTLSEKAETGAIDFTQHWKKSVFRCPSNHLRQVYLLDLLAQRGGLVGVIGGKSGSLEGTAMLGINTLWFCNGAPPYYEPRLYQWDMIPHYREVSIAGFVITRRVRAGTENNPLLEDVPYAEQRIGPISGEPLAIIRACLDLIAAQKKNGLDLRAVKPKPVVIDNL